MNYSDDFEEGRGILRLENELKKNLTPIHPNPGFISSLKKKLSTGSTTVLERRDDLQGLLMLGLGVMIGALLLILFRRQK
jgi:hypothetical protein